MSTAAQSKDPRNPKTLLRYHQVFIINGQAVTMKIDSGAQNSIISKLDWQRMGQPALTPPTRERISSAGTTVQLEGEFDADVEFEGKHYTLPLQVSSRDTTRNLTGRRWFPVFNSLDWNALFYDGGKIVKLPNASSEAASDQIEKETITIPYFLRIKVENKVLIMKLDTGATASVIGLSEWKQIGEPKLEQPKRRMTDTAGCVKKKSATDLTVETQNDQLASTSQITPVLQLNGEQQAIGLELVHNVSTLLCLLSSQATAFKSPRSDFVAEIKASRSGTAIASAPFGTGPAGQAKFQHKASHNQRLEELRNLQDRLSKEKAEWARERSMQDEHISEQRKQLLKLQEQVRLENTDTQQQRENIYQKLKALRNIGIGLSPNMTIVSSAPMPSAVSPSGCEEVEMTASSPPPPAPPTSASSLVPSPTPSSVDLGRRKTISGGPNTAGMGAACAGPLKRESCSNLPLPMNLISAKNEQKAVVALATTLPIKQQLPMKLAKLAATTGSNDHSAAGTTTSGPSGAHGMSSTAAPLRPPAAAWSSNCCHCVFPRVWSINGPVPRC